MGKGDEEKHHFRDLLFIFTRSSVRYELHRVLISSRKKPASKEARLPAQLRSHGHSKTPTTPHFT